MMAGVLWSWGPGPLPMSLALSALCLLMAAMVVAWAGAEASWQGNSAQRFGWFACGMLMAGFLSALVASVQVFAPDLPDGEWVARSGLAGLAVGNLRQPNHLSSLLLWAVIAAVALLELGWLRRGGTAGVVALLTFALVLSGSRTGALGLAVLVVWSLIDRRLSPAARVILLATPLVYGAGLWIMSLWAAQGDLAYGAAGRFVAAGGGDLSSSRFGIWANTLTLIARQPFTGVGFGEFNLAWSLSAFPGRPVAFFDHTHNLPLQLAVELGLPLASLILVGLMAALGQAWVRVARRSDAAAPAARAALMMVLMIGLHSLLEYPLWYAYFLLPAAFAWGFALGVPSRPGADQHRSGLPGLIAGLALAAGGSIAVLDYLRVVVIFAPPDGAGSLTSRIARGQHSPWFGHHADYAAATSGDDPRGRDDALERAPHYLLDTRLMIAWSEALAARGELDKARWLVARLREFRNPAAEEFLSACASPNAVAFQCQKPVASYDWHAFVR